MIDCSKGKPTMALRTIVGCIAISTMLSGCLTPGDDGGLIRIDAPNGPGGGHCRAADALRRALRLRAPTVTDCDD